MSRPRPTAGKREVQQHKREKALGKAERRSARRSAAPEERPAGGGRSEADLIEELATLQRAAEAGQVSGEELDEHRERIRLQIVRLQL